jgi:hypothetical protein
VLWTADLAGYGRATSNLAALAIAEILDDGYRRCGVAVTNGGGRVVKYMGDACLATFPEERCEQAVESARALEHAVEGLSAGIRISEPVYRQLPNDRRPGWTKNRPPATYSASRS